MTNTSRDTIVGLFEDQRTAQAVLDELISNGFTRDQVHLESKSSYAGDAAAGGAALTGRAPAENRGGFMGWLDSLFGGDEYDEHATRYGQAVDRGGYIVAVDAEEGNRDRIVDILNAHGAIDVDEHAAKHGYGMTSDVNTDAAAVSNKGAGSIPVVQEELQIGKRSVQRGGVRVYSRVIEQPVEEDVQLRQEKVTVDRRPVNRPVTDADEAALRDQTVEVKEMAEEAVVNKQARVVEEVRIGKEATQKTQKVRDTVRRTEVQTEDLGTTSTGPRYTDDFRQDFQTRYGASGGTYETYAPAYDFGSRMAADSRYQGRSWTDVESTLRTDYLRDNPNSTWDQVKGAVRYGWEKVTGQR